MKGILFNKELGMFDAVVSEGKTQTRRIISSSPKTARPRLKEGEVVFLKEPYHVVNPYSRNPGVFYKYHFSDVLAMYDAKDHWRNKMFMPAKFARYFIKIISVGTERLQEISQRDAISEGIMSKDYTALRATALCKKVSEIPRYLNFRNYAKKTDEVGYMEFTSAIESYRSLWEVINGVGSWKENPYIYKYEFEFLHNYKLPEKNV